MGIALDSIVSYSIESSLNRRPGCTLTEFYLVLNFFRSFLASFLTDDSMVADYILT